MPKGKKKGRKAGPILAPVDFSKSSVKAVLWACMLAKHYKTDVLIFHAVHDPNDRPSFYNKQKKNLARPHVDVAEKMMKQFLKRILKLLPKYAHKRITIQVEKGLPAELILKAAEKSNAMMIVMGSIGQSSLKKFLIGSVTEDVIKKTSVPVVSVKKDQRP